MACRGGAAWGPQWMSHRDSGLRSLLATSYTAWRRGSFDPRFPWASASHLSAAGLQWHTVLFSQAGPDWKRSHLFPPGRVGTVFDFPNGLLAGTDVPDQCLSGPALG